MLDGMGKTSVYLSTELAARVKASGVPLSELVRRGLDAGLAPELDAVLAMLRTQLDRTAVHPPEPERVPSIAAAVPARARSDEDTPAPRTHESKREPSAQACTHRLPRGAWCKLCEQPRG